LHHAVAGGGKALNAQQVTPGDRRAGDGNPYGCSIDIGDRQQRETVLTEMS
jgi:hypothetical protein